MFPLIRLRFRALRIRILDRTVRRLSRRHRVLAAAAGILVARRAAQRLLWRGTVRPGEGLQVTMRRRGPADTLGPR
ncbi:MAG TPA: hypothetical protein VEI83_10600 [Acidimicrobiales bacterium]|nr:hypothetical protein [Acidimicrobiales bacterium]